MDGNRANHIAIALRALILGLFAAFGIMVIGATSANADDGELLGSLTEQATEPLTQQVTAPVIEESSTAVTEPVVEQVAGPVAEAAVQPVVQQIAEPIVGQAAAPVIEPVVEEVAKPIASNIAEPVVEQVAKPIVNQVAVPVVEPVVEQVAKPVIEKVVIPVVNSTVAPVKSTLQPVMDSAQSTLDPVTNTVETTLDSVTEPAVEHVVDPIVEFEEQVNESIGESAVTPHESSPAGSTANVVEHVVETDSASTTNPALLVQQSEADVRTSNHKTRDVTNSTQPSSGGSVIGPVQLTSMNMEASTADASISDSTADPSALVLPSAGMSDSHDVGVESTGGNFDVAAPGAPAPAGSATSSAGNTSATAYLTDHYLLPHQLVGGQQHHASWALPSSTFSDPGFSPD